MPAGSQLWRRLPKSSCALLSVHEYALPDGLHTGSGHEIAHLPLAGIVRPCAGTRGGRSGQHCAAHGSWPRQCSHHWGPLLSRLLPSVPRPVVTRLASAASMLILQITSAIRCRDNLDWFCTSLASDRIPPPQPTSKSLSCRSGSGACGESLHQISNPDLGLSDMRGACWDQPMTYPRCWHRVRLMKSVRRGLRACRGAKGPAEFHHSSASLENFSASARAAVDWPPAVWEAASLTYTGPGIGLALRKEALSSAGPPDAPD